LYQEELSKSIERTFEKYSDECVITKEMIFKIEADIIRFIENK
jgi:hypothetical protein